MKSASEIFTPEHTENNSQNTEKHSNSTHGHYFLVAILLVVAFLLSTWVASTPNVLPSTQTWSGFILFWLGGGLVTLFLLTLAAKR
ncbi:MAG: hypothetical protein IMF06_03765 [Proteobacteria bacterium]|nr:hypothetical protein [Pseudomonadota bacterium]